MMTEKVLALVLKQRVCDWAVGHAYPFLGVFHSDCRGSVCEYMDS